MLHRLLAREKEQTHCSQPSWEQQQVSPPGFVGSESFWLESHARLDAPHGLAPNNVERATCW